MYTITINDQKIEVEKSSTILEAAKKLNIRIPTLCHMDLHNLKMVNKAATCRVCVVEVEGRKNLAPACATPVTDGMVVRTNNIRCIKARRTIVELLLSNHPKDCLICEKNLDCELQALAAELNIREIKYEGERTKSYKDTSSLSVVRNMEKCILCRRCETMCSEVQTVNVLSPIHRGFQTVPESSYDRHSVYVLWTVCCSLPNWCTD